MYIALIQNKRTYETKEILVFEDLKIGTEIGYDKDENEKDGIAKWTVFDCTKKEIEK